MSNKKNRGFRAEAEPVDESMVTDSVESTLEENLDTEDAVEEEMSHEEESAKEVRGVVSCDRLNLRKNPFEKFGNVIETLARGTELVIEPSTLNDEWCKVYTSVGVSGYCKREFISVIE